MTHALLGGSNAHRWLHCTRSARLESMVADRTSEAAREGTAAHALLEWKLKRLLGPPPGPRPTSIYSGDEMERHTDDCVEYITALIHKADEPPIARIEQRVDFSRWVPKGSGTTDFLMATEDTLYVLDFKYGAGILVTAEDNPQLMLYSLGGIDMLSGIFSFERVVMTIHQPRRENVSTFEMDAKTLLCWADKTLQPAASLAYQGLGKFEPGDHCQFCRVATTCRARAEAQLLLAKYEFDRPPLLSDEEVSAILPKLDRLIAWAKDLKDYALYSAVNGKSWDGYKLVAGKANRCFADEGKVEEAALAAGFTNIYRKSLITLTDMERLMGKSFPQILGNLVVKPNGKPTLVPVNDKRPALSRPTAAEDFA